MEKLRLPVIKHKIPAAKQLSMDKYMKFVFLNLKYTVDKKAIEKPPAVIPPFFLR